MNFVVFWRYLYIFIVFSNTSGCLALSYICYNIYWKPTKALAYLSNWEIQLVVYRFRQNYRCIFCVPEIGFRAINPVCEWRFFCLCGSQCTWQGKRSWHSKSLICIPYSLLCGKIYLCKLRHLVIAWNITKLTWCSGGKKLQNLILKASMFQSSV